MKWTAKIIKNKYPNTWIMYVPTHLLGAFISKSRNHINDRIMLWFDVKEQYMKGYLK